MGNFAAVPAEKGEKGLYSFSSGFCVREKEGLL